MLSEKKSKWLIRAGIALPILFIFYFVYRYGITVPFWDEWEFVPVLEKFHNHTLTLRDFWEQHNDDQNIRMEYFSRVVRKYNFSGYQSLFAVLHN